MHFKSFKSLASVSAFALALAFTVGTAHAQGTANMNVGLQTDNTFTVTKTQDPNFGEWFVVHDGVNNIILTLDGATGAVSEASPGASQAVSIDNAAEAEGIVTIAAPIGPVAINMTADNLSDFAAGSQASLTDITYNDGNGNSGSIDPASFPVGPLGLTTDALGAMSLVLGGEITFSSSPANGTYSATYDLTFSY